MPVVTLIAAVVGVVAAVGLLLVERRTNPSGGVFWLPAAVAGARLALVVLIAYGLRRDGTARRGGGAYFGILLAEIVNIFMIIIDGLAAFSAGFGQTFKVLISIDVGDQTPQRYLSALLATAVIGLLADLVIGLALAIRRTILD
ncbi:hypothetical protein ABIA39_003725 [Nocardia sp. GAS34]|uniref:hypothetical protein n=1 Tax=unclassified Nocardia TaxID=2637762 RepID=UPI003D23A7BA